MQVAFVCSRQGGRRSRPAHASVLSIEGDVVIIFPIWLILAVIVALIAIDKGRDGVRWFLYGMLAWPLALPHILLLRRPPTDPASPTG